MKILYKQKQTLMVSVKTRMKHSINLKGLETFGVDRLLSSFLFLSFVLLADVKMNNPLL